MSDTRDPENRSNDDMPHYDGPAGGWGSLQGMARILGTEKPSPGMIETLQRQNKTDGHMCTSCAWAKPAKPHPFEFCENGAKATMWDLTSKRCTPEFFAKHSVSELRQWKDYDLEIEGRLTHPMRYDPATDHYVPVGWDEAFQGIGAHLKTLDPKSVIFYASGRASLETSYLYALFARVYGHNNLPDSSNMCHETTSVALTKVIGAPVGTCTLDDFEHCDAIFFFGQNTGSNSPRFLHPLQEAVKRGCRIVTFNPLKEKGLEEFVSPQNPAQMLTGKPTKISYQYHQVKAGGDIAAILGMCKFILECDKSRRAEIGTGVIDEDFIAQHTHGFDAFKAKCAEVSWDEIEANSGLSRTALMDAARVYMDAEKVIGIYGMGLTQHVHGFENIGLLTNFLLLRGNIGRQGAGMSPVRGHSNVQGQRTVGIAEKTKLVPLDKIAEQFGFEPPREDGMNTVEACEGIVDGSVKGFVSLGGNFVRAIPDIVKMEDAWTAMELTVQIATKLNRSHLINGKSAWLLPCLVRSEQDMQTSGPQWVSMEDSLSHVHASRGKRPPASEHLMSELAIVSGLAKAVLEPNPKLRWDDWTADYSLVRDLIAETYADEFYDMNERMHEAGGFYRGNSARDRIWKTESGKAEFTTPDMLSATGVEDKEGRYRLITLRSNDQFNTTIYGYSDRFRGIEGTRHVVLINPREMKEAGLQAGQRVTLVGDAGDGEDRAGAGPDGDPLRSPRRLPRRLFPRTQPAGAALVSRPAIQDSRFQGRSGKDRSRIMACGNLIDEFGRTIRYLRMSVTDRCDLRCNYCMGEAMQFLPRRELLDLDELVQVADAFIARGVNKIRLTGGRATGARGDAAADRGTGQAAGLHFWRGGPGRAHHDHQRHQSRAPRGTNRGGGREAAQRLARHARSGQIRRADQPRHAGPCARRNRRGARCGHKDQAQHRRSGRYQPRRNPRPDRLGARQGHGHHLHRGDAARRYRCRTLRPVPLARNGAARPRNALHAGAVQPRQRRPRALLERARDRRADRLHQSDQP